MDLENEDGLFRAEAVESFADERRRESADALRLSSAWTRWGFWLLLILTVLAAAFAWPLLPRLLPGMGG